MGGELSDAAIRLFVRLSVPPRLGEQRLGQATRAVRAADLQIRRDLRGGAYRLAAR